MRVIVQNNIMPNALKYEGFINPKNLYYHYFLCYNIYVEARYSPQDHLTKLTQSLMGTTFLIGAVLFPLLEFMDYFVSPQNFRRFMTYRLIISGVLVLMYYLNRLKTSRPYQYTIGTIATAASAVTIELAVLQSGGQSSLYYAAMVILTICALGFVPINILLAFFFVGVIYAIYLIPILLTEHTFSGVFISNNAFLISAFVVGILLRYHNQKLIITELGLREELYEDRRKIERYSTELETLVAEKTQELAVSEQRYRALFDNANDGIVVLDAGGIIVNVNHSFCEMHNFDRDSLIGTHYRLLEIEGRPGEMEERFRRLREGAALVYEAEHFRKDGVRIFLGISSKAIDLGGTLHIQSFHRDITERKKLQEQLFQSQKMESIGVLAGGIAHDFNNTLTAILSHTEVARRRMNSDDIGLKSVKTIEDAARRAGQMVSKLLSFARKESFELTPMNLNAVVKDTAELLERTLAVRAIKARVDLNPDIPSVKGDCIHIEQVITNLVMNSMDAMPSGGKITISTHSRDLGPDAHHVHPLLVPGKYVVLSIADTGGGIPKEIMDRIFDPFFTTKPAGKGTGLGLAMVYGIVKGHKGEIRVLSGQGNGTTFEIYFPAAGSNADVPAQKSAEVPQLQISGSECVLVVDDEKEVLAFIKNNLDARGYKTLVADNTAYAQELFNEMGKDIDLVIADMVMPVMNGMELGKLFKEAIPALKVIGMTGFADRVPDDETIFSGFMKKPFDGALLLSTVRKVLDENKDISGR